MIIKSLELKGNTRLSLNKIDSLYYTPINSKQVILGTNGSGKSSLLEELSPLPADLTKFYKNGGSKTITIEHEQSLFILTSGINGKNKHSFVKNNEELNDGGTRKVQLQLVKEHFSYTPDLHKVLLGTNSFTSMSTADRKNWFTNIRSNDYTYAFKLYNTLKSRHRDIVGGIKVLSKRISDDQKSLKSEEEMLSARELHKFICGYIDSLLDLKINTYLVEDNTELMVSKTKILKRELSNLEENNNFNIDQLKTEIIYNNKELDKLYEQVDKYKAMEISLSNSDSSTNMEIGELESKILEITKSIYLKGDIPSIYNKVQFQISDLETLVSELRSFTNIKPTTVYKNKLDKLLHDKKTTSDKLDKLYSELKSLEHLRDHDKVSCPKCNHEWHRNYNPETHDTIKTLVNRNKSIIDKIEVELTNLKVTLEEANERDNILHALNSIVKEPNIKIFWDHCLNSDLNILMDNLTKTYNDLERWSKLPDLQNNLNRLIELDKAKKDLASLSIGGMNNIGKTIQQTEIEINRLIKRNASLTTDINRQTLINTKKNNIQNMANELNKIIKINNEYEQYRTVEYFNNQINVILKEAKEIQYKLETEIEEANFVIKKIDIAKQDLNKLNIEKDRLTSLIKTLSPNEGLIAKTIIGFLKYFVNEMNKIIKTVWSYDLEILSCDIDANSNSDLDYKFPFIINGSDRRDDVNLASAGMKEIIDLAFKIVSMRIMKIDRYPLFLDEFARTMDPGHRDKAYAIVDSDALRSHSQVFLVTHYESFYGRFNNVDVSVLSDLNMNLDGVGNINKVFKIK